MKNILVTGGLGYIGSHTVVNLIASGYHIIIIDDLSNTDISVKQNIELITNSKIDLYLLDLKNLNSLENLFSKFSFDAIIHFAAYKAVGESVIEPLKYYQNNIIGLINLLTCIEKYNLDNIVFSSSCAIYGQAKVLPITEETPIITPLSPYGKSKKMSEEVLHDYAIAKNKNIISLRYFNPIGAHESGLIGELPNGIPNNLMPYLNQVALGLQNELYVFGNDYDTIDGTAVRDYIDVNDIAVAHIKAIERLLNKSNETNIEYFNLGSGVGSTVLEVINAFEKANNIKIKYSFKPRRAGDIEKAYADYSKAKDLLGWQPNTPLEISMKTAWKFQQNLSE